MTHVDLRWPWGRVFGVGVVTRHAARCRAGARETSKFTRSCTPRSATERVGLGGYVAAMGPVRVRDKHNAPRGAAGTHAHAPAPRLKNRRPSGPDPQRHLKWGGGQLARDKRNIGSAGSSDVDHRADDACVVFAVVVVRLVIFKVILGFGNLVPDIAAVGRDVVRPGPPYAATARMAPCLSCCVRPCSIAANFVTMCCLLTSHDCGTVHGASAM